MDLSLTRDTVRVNDAVFESSADHPVDCDIILPDYCPDIARILKTEACAYIESKTLEAGRLTISGTLGVKTIYIPENSRAVRSVTHEEVFSHNFDVKDGDESGYIHAKVKVLYANCRPLGPRRLQIKAAIGIAAKVWCQKEENFICGSDDNRIEMLTKGLKASELVGATDKQFKLSDELELGYGKPPIAAVIKADGVAVMQDYKVISNKVIAKGEILLHTVYACESTDEKDSPRLEVMDHSIPVSQIIDLEGADEDCNCDVRFMTSDVKVEGITDADGENKALSAEMILGVSVRAYKSQEFNIITDAYSTDFDMDVKSKPISFEHIVDYVKTNEMIRESVDLTGLEISSVTDAMVKADVSGVKFEGNALLIDGNLNVSVLSADSQGGPGSFDKSLPFKMREELKSSSDNMHCDPDITVVSVGYSMLGMERLDLRIECSVEAMIFGVYSDNALINMDMDENRPKECKDRKTLTLYYADKDEKVWDIAKRYNTSMDSIKKENNLDNEALPERSMLLIPKKRCPR